MTARMFRWRWAMIFGAILNVWNLVDCCKTHDVTGWPLPSAWVLPWLTFGCVGYCVFVAGVWGAYLYKPDPSG